MLQVQQQSVTYLQLQTMKFSWYEENLNFTHSHQAGLNTAITNKTCRTPFSPVRNPDSRQISARNSLFALHLSQPYSPRFGTYVLRIYDLFLWIIFPSMSHLFSRVLNLFPRNIGSRCKWIYTYFRMFVSSSASLHTSSDFYVNCFTKNTFLSCSWFSFIHTTDRAVCLAAR
jgi:hypothetical protein